MNSQSNVQDGATTYEGVLKAVQSHLAGRDQIVQAIVSYWGRLVDRQMELEGLLAELGAELPMHPKLSNEASQQSSNICTGKRGIDSALILQFAREELLAKGPQPEEVLYAAVRSRLKVDGYNGRGAKQLLTKLIASPAYETLLSEIK